MSMTGTLALYPGAAIRARPQLACGFPARPADGNPCSHD